MRVLLLFLFTLALQAQTIAFTVGNSGLTSLTWNSVNVNHTYNNLLTSVTSSVQGTVSPPSGCSTSLTATSVTQNCTNGTAPFSVTVTFAAIDGNTLTAQVALTNTGNTETIASASVNLLGLTYSQFDQASSYQYGISSSVPLEYVSFGSGRFGIWNPSPSSSYQIVGQQNGNAPSMFSTNSVVLYNVAPGATNTQIFWLRFTTDMTSANNVIWPEAYSTFASTYGYALNHPDRRPVMAWFLSSFSNSTANNPRGWTFGGSYNVNADDAGYSNFQKLLASQANTVISLIKARPIQPQGILFWDIEGQEFAQPTSYIGDPRWLNSGYAPEMNAAVDAMVSAFQSAGYAVGFTLRPSFVNTVSSLPSSCAYNSQGAMNSYYLVTAAAFGQRFYTCNSDGASFTLKAKGSGYQQGYGSNANDAIVALLTAKVNYARARWGARLFYVDSTAYSDGSGSMSADIWRTLQRAFPDTLFFPENNVFGNVSSAMPYSEPTASGPPAVPVFRRYAYPSANYAVNVANCSGLTAQGQCWPNNVNAFQTGVALGDIDIYTQPQGLSAAQLTAIESMIAAGRAQQTNVVVTDSGSGKSHTFTGDPLNVQGTYPVKMRVYFAATPDGLATSSTYCENGQLSGGNGCTLNLSGMRYFNLQYFDFSNNLVTAGPPRPYQPGPRIRTRGAGGN